MGKDGLQTGHGVSMRLPRAAEICAGALHRPADGGITAPSHFEGLTTDSRAVAPGNAFLALRGERFDGHDFAAIAAEAGAALLILERQLPDVDCAQLVVDDTLDALARLAHAWRREVAPKTVAITGSVGKTTTKELLGQILAEAGPTHVTPGNFNNHIGLPLTLLGMPAQTRYLIAEMGMNAPGEIAALVEVAEPDVGVITAIAPVHLEGLGSVEAIAAAKAELFTALGPSQSAVYPACEPLLTPHLAGLKAQRCSFGCEQGADVRLVSVAGRGSAGSRVELSIDGERCEIALPLVGRHNAQNAACAAATAYALGLDRATIVAGLERPPRLQHRSALRELGPYHVYDDCYNASPAAVRAALETLVELAEGGPCWAVLGEMRELGEASERLHREVGAYAATLPLTGLITTSGDAAAIVAGAKAAGMAAARLFEEPSPDAAGERLATHAASGSWVLFKGSRGARVEKALESVERAVQARSKS